jgi:hypothetical protein
MMPLHYIIEHGSLVNTRDLKRVIIALDKRIKRIRKKLCKPQADTDLLLEEFRRARIYRDEFNTLKNQL